MCIVIDINMLKKVFDESAIGHKQYKPVLDWILRGKGKMVCGGSQYWDELGKASKYLKFVNQLNSARKLVKVDDKEIDAMRNKLSASCSDKDFDDPHIVALLIVSKVKIVCSEDARSYPYITNKSWYPTGQNVPKIYCSSAFKHAKKMLQDSNIVNICLPCIKLKRDDAKQLLN